jgi:hypothetical protein
MKLRLPIVVGYVSALRSTLLSSGYVAIVDRRPDLKWIGGQISHTYYRMPQ